MQRRGFRWDSLPGAQSLSREGRPRFCALPASKIASSNARPSVFSCHGLEPCCDPHATARRSAGHLSGARRCRVELSPGASPSVQGAPWARASLCCRSIYKGLFRSVPLSAVEVGLSARWCRPPERPSLSAEPLLAMLQTPGVFLGPSPSEFCRSAPPPGVCYPLARGRQRFLSCRDVPPLLRHRLARSLFRRALRADAQAFPIKSRLSRSRPIRADRMPLDCVAGASRWRGIRGLRKRAPFNSACTTVGDLRPA